jgi:hypothetical protein
MKNYNLTNNFYKLVSLRQQENEFKSLCIIIQLINISNSETFKENVQNILEFINWEDQIFFDSS